MEKAQLYFLKDQETKPLMRRNKLQAIMLFHLEYLLELEEICQSP